MQGEGGVKIDQILRSELKSIIMTQRYTNNNPNEPTL